MKLRGTVKYNVGHFFAKVERSTKFCFVASRRLSSRHETCSSLGFSTPNLDGNKLAKGMCLATKAKDREVFI